VAAIALAAALAAPAAGVARVPQHRDERVVQHFPRHHPAPREARTPPRPRPLARVQAVAREFSINLSRRVLPAGAAAVELVNLGEDPHDLRVERAGRPSTGFSFELAKPGSVSRVKTRLGPGRWRLYCTLDGHAAAGMSATLTVAG
jgi:hypothetical protein